MVFFYTPKKFITTTNNLPSYWFLLNLAIVPRDVIEYWRTKEETEITYNEVRLFETKRLPLERMQEMIPVLKAFLDDLSRGVLDLNSFQNRKYRHFTPEATKVLKREFELNRNPTKAKIELLASQFRVNATKVRNWFREKKR
jgi:Homeodomain